MDALHSEPQKDRKAPTLLLDLGAVPTDHPVLPIPFTAEIDGRQCLGEGLSLVRAEVAGLLDPALQGQERLVRLSFAFKGFTVALGVRCRITGIQGPSGKAVLVFTDPTGDHLPQLRHLLNAWIAEDLVALGPILSVASSQSSGPKAGRAALASGHGLLSRIAGTGLMLAAAVGLVATAMTLTYARLYTATLPIPARIGAEGQMLTALASGQIDFVNPAAIQGEVAFSLRSETGTLLSVAMPCDCVAALQGVEVGSTVQAGDPVMLVHGEDAPLTATVQVPTESLFSLSGAEITALTFGDGQRVIAKVKEPLPLPGSRGDALVPVTLEPLVPLPATRAGSLAEVTVSLPAPALLMPARDLYRALGG